MRSIGFFMLGVTLSSVCAIAAVPLAKQDASREKGAAPGKQSDVAATFQAIKKEAEKKLESIYAAANKEVEAAKNEEERDAIQMRIGTEASKVFKEANDRVMAAVRGHAADQGAVESLVWVVNRSGGSALGDEAAALLHNHHLTNPQTIELGYRRKRSPMNWTEPLLRAQLASSNLPEADRPRLTLALAEVKQTLSALPGILAVMSEDHLKQMDRLYGKETVEAFRKIDVTKSEAEAVALYNELAAKYGDKKIGGDRTFGALAKSAIFEIQNLSVGKTAPEIAAEDTDGVPFKLSDYRGKVVLISFWATWCGPCMAQVPHEREIVERLKDKPFALIGVNGDMDKKQIKEGIAKAKINWRSFWCGEKGPEGAIPAAWNVRAWPTVYVLDHKGVIRGKELFGKSLDLMVEKLVREAEEKR